MTKDVICVLYAYCYPVFSNAANVEYIAIDEAILQLRNVKKQGHTFLAWNQDAATVRNLHSAIGPGKLYSVTFLGTAALLTGHSCLIDVDS